MILPCKSKVKPRTSFELTSEIQVIGGCSEVFDFKETINEDVLDGVNSMFQE